MCPTGARQRNIPWVGLYSEGTRSNRGLNSIDVNDRSQHTWQSPSLLVEQEEVAGATKNPWETCTASHGGILYQVSSAVLIEGSMGCFLFCYFFLVAKT